LKTTRKITNPYELHKWIQTGYYQIFCYNEIDEINYYTVPDDFLYNQNTEKYQINASVYVLSV